MGKEWDEKLFGCFANIPVCLIALVPGGVCILQASAVDNASHEGKLIPYLFVCCLGVIGGTINREKIRKSFDLEGSCLTSFATWLFCGPCAVCQEYREAAWKASNSG